MANDKHQLAKHEEAINAYYVDVLYPRLFKDGDKLAILQCLTFCENYRVAIPDWLRAELAQAADRYLERTSENFHDALFGAQKTSGRHSHMSTSRGDRLKHQHWFDVAWALSENGIKGDELYDMTSTIVVGRYALGRDCRVEFDPHCAIDKAKTNKPKLETVKRRIEMMKRKGVEHSAYGDLMSWDFSHLLRKRKAPRRAQKPST